MRKDLKKYVENAIEKGLNRKELGNKLLGKISDRDLAFCLKYFDKMYKKKNAKSKFKISNIPVLLINSIRVFLLFFLYIFFRIVTFFKRIFLDKNQETTFSEFDDSFLKKLKKWFKLKSAKEKRVIIGLFLLSIFILFLVFYANFIFYKDCHNSSCFREMMEKCNRASYVSSELIGLENKITGKSFSSCVVKISSLENHLGIDAGKQMTCVFPKGFRALPQSRIDFCSGELREEIQSVLISELYKVIAQNTDELNDFFKIGGTTSL